MTASTSSPTVASYTDAEYSGSTFTAATLAAITPTITPSTTSAGASWSASSVGSSPAYTLIRAIDSAGTGATSVYGGTATSTTDTGGTAASAQNTFVRSVSTGNGFACAIGDGQVYCWGNNSYGNLGNGTTTSPSTTPTLVSLNSSDVTAVSAGYAQACAIVAGAAWCWGRDLYGALGNGSNATQFTSPQPVSGLAGKTVTSISVGSDYTCAIASGGAYCWGYNGNGQLGIGSTTDANTAQPVTGLSSSVSSISAGSGATTCATSHGLVYCWGYNGYGQVGDNTTTQRTTPTLVSPWAATASRAATAVTVGNSHACALTDAGVACWGLGASGQLGNGSTSNYSTAQAVSGSSTWAATSISASDDHTCALASSGAIWCWGVGTNGELGNGSTVTTNSSPVAVASSGALSGVTVRVVSSGVSATCASGQGGVYCWGANGFYQLGDGTTITRSTPVAATNPTVTGCTNGASLLAGSVCSLAPGTSYWWRLRYAVGPWSSPYSSWIQATTGTRATVAPSAASTTAASTTLSWSPYTPTGLQTGRYVLQRATDTSGSNLTTLTDGATTSYTDTTGYSSSGTPKVTTVGTAKAGACMLAGDAVWCYGTNSSGQLGNGTTSDNVSAPSRVVGLDGMKITGLGSNTISADDQFRCAIANGAAYCWGNNSNGELGNGTTTSSSVPVPVSTSTGLAGKTVTAISSSDTHTCAVTSDKLLFCWGYNPYGGLGNGTQTSSSTPVQVTSQAGNWTAVSAGSSRTCAIASGAAYCWGENGSGAVGNNLTTNQLSPAAVMTSTMTGTVTAISTGYNSSCAIAGGALYCWGNDSWGQLGNSNTSQVNTPTQVTTSGVLSGLTPTSVSVGAQFACAVASGAAYCWGYNVSGQLGNNVFSCGSTNGTTCYSGSFYNGSTRNMAVSSPVAVYTGGTLSGKTVTSVSGGYRKTCAVASGGAYCWGAGAGGFGDGSGSTSDSSVPVAVSMPTGTVCPTGASHLSATSCSLAANTTYYYRITYYIGSWTGPTSGWVAVTTSSS